MDRDNKMKWKHLIIFTLLALILSFLNLHVIPCEFLVDLETGKILDCRENSHSWGSGESHSTTMGIIKCSTMSMETGRSYLETEPYFHFDYMSEINLRALLTTQRLSLSEIGVSQCLFAD